MVFSFRLFRFRLFHDGLICRFSPELSRGDRMKKMFLMLVPVIAAVAIVAAVSAHPQFGPQWKGNATQEGMSPWDHVQGRGPPINITHNETGPCQFFGAGNATQEEKNIALGLAFAFPLAYTFFDAGNMTQEEKDLRVQMLELGEDMMKTEISYLKGKITKDEFDEELKQHSEEMKSLQKEMEQFQPVNTDSFEGGSRGRGRGPRMGW
jgi:hypothetical protein